MRGEECCRSVTNRHWPKDTRVEEEAAEREDVLVICWEESRSVLTVELN